MVPQVARLGETLAEALDLLDVVDLEDLAAARVGVGLEEESDKDGPLGVSVDAASGVALREGGEEEGRALGGTTGGGRSDVGAGAWGILEAQGEDVEVGWFHEFFLDAGWGDVNEITERNVSS